MEPLVAANPWLLAASSAPPTPTAKAKHFQLDVNKSDSSVAVLTIRALIVTIVLSYQSKAIEKNSSYPPDCLPELHSQLSWNACISSSALSKPQGKAWQDGPALITHLKRRTSSKSPSSLKVFLPSPALMQHRCKAKKNGDRPLLRFVFWGNHKRQRGRLPRGHSLRCPPESLLPLPLPLPKGSDPCCLCNLPM